MKKIKKIIKGIARKFGYDIIPFNPGSSHEAFLLKIIKKFEIDVILDVGANSGQYGRYLRNIGYAKHIISFEPMKTAYEKLSKVCEKDKMWFCENVGLGASKTEAVIHIAKNSQSSSLLEMAKSHIKGAPDSVYIGEEMIKIETLSYYKNSLLKKGKNIFLKIDTQGYEKEVLDGALELSNHIKIIQLELSFKELYKRAPIFNEMIQYMNKLGYYLISLEKVFSDVNTDELLQVDGMFIKNE